MTGFAPTGGCVGAVVGLDGTEVARGGTGVAVGGWGVGLGGTGLGATVGVGGASVGTSAVVTGSGVVSVGNSPAVSSSSGAPRWITTAGVGVGALAEPSSAACPKTHSVQKLSRGKTPQKTLPGVFAMAKRRHQLYSARRLRRYSSTMPPNNTPTAISRMAHRSTREMVAIGWSLSLFVLCHLEGVA